jgi:hypothetical protein
MKCTGKFRIKIPLTQLLSYIVFYLHDCGIQLYSGIDLKEVSYKNSSNTVIELHSFYLHDCGIQLYSGIDLSTSMVRLTHDTSALTRHRGFPVCVCVIRTRYTHGRRLAVCRAQQ